MPHLPLSFECTDRSFAHVPLTTLPHLLAWESLGKLGCWLQQAGIFLRVPGGLKCIIFMIQKKKERTQVVLIAKGKKGTQFFLQVYHNNVLFFFLTLDFVDFVLCVFCLPVCKCTTCTHGADGGQKRVLAPLELESQMRVSSPVVAGCGTWVLCNISKRSAEPCLQPLQRCF